MKVHWQEWEDAMLTDWEDVGEIATEREFNDAIRGAVEDASPWCQEGFESDASIVCPASVRPRSPSGRWC
jgi:hypothetical protein